ncbi:vascular endothelial growth factor A-A-like [Copidosoma floridanum]|uniref:vascular endothelial growth factor A-A-like n=1 Tax=Copidosoma floridanum TaxID=29053 RepID=UPI0006C9BDC4|nr:vascular endothelial growth factor A-A-like [Copidosoma floridanum]
MKPVISVIFLMLCGYSVRLILANGAISNSHIKLASCMLEWQVVPITLDLYPNLIYHPKCVRVKRCGGCCNHKLLTCKPTESQMVSYPVTVIDIVRENKEFQIQTEILVHTICECTCSNTEKHHQIEVCALVCTNKNEERSCRKNRDLMWWSVDECKCKCREVEICSEGLHFNYDVCRLL